MICAPSVRPGSNLKLWGVHYIVLPVASSFFLDAAVHFSCWSATIHGPRLVNGLPILRTWAAVLPVRICAFVFRCTCCICGLLIADRTTPLLAYLRVSVCSSRRVSSFLCFCICLRPCFCVVYVSVSVRACPPACCGADFVSAVYRRP